METPAKLKNVCYASITNGREQCSISNMVSAIRMQGAMLQAPMKLEFRFEKTLADAINAFYKNEKFDVLVAIDNFIAFPEAFVVNNAMSEDPEKEIVTGVYPMAGEVDWERIRAKAEDTSEPNDFKGNKYNLDISSAEVIGSEWAKVRQCKLDCLVIRRSAIDRIASEHPEVVHQDGLLVHVESLKDGRKLTNDETFCSLYGKPIWADLGNPCSSFGSMVFCGVVGLRSSLR